MNRNTLDPGFARAVEDLLVQQVQGTTTGRLGRRTHDQEPRYRRVLPIVVTGAVVVLLSAIVLNLPGPGLGGLGGTPAAKPDPSVTVGGEVLPYAGRIPWADPTIPADETDTVTISADGDRIMQRFFVCGLPTERVAVTETAHAVGIAVFGYVKPLPSGVSCGSPGHAPQPLVVRLSRPLGDRILIDPATGMRHRPVIAAATSQNHPDLAVARVEVTRLLASAVLPKGATPIASTSIALLRSPDSTIGCSPLATAHRFVRVPNSTPAAVERYLVAHPTSSLRSAGTGSAGDGSGVTDLSVLQQADRSDETSPTLDFVASAQADATIIRIDATVVPTGATCGTHGHYSGLGSHR